MGGIVPADDLPGSVIVPAHDLPANAYQPPSAGTVARMAGNLGRKRADNAAAVLRQQDPGVDYAGVNDPGNRALYSIMATPQEKTSFLQKQYGADKVSTDSFGRHVIQQGDKTTAFLPRGDAQPGGVLSSYADIAGDVAPVGGMVAGAMAGAPGGVAGSMLGSGLGASAGESMNKILKSLMGYNQQTGEQVGSDIAMQIPKGMAAEGAGQLAMLLGRTALAPYAERSLLGPNVEAIPAYRERMAAVQGARDMGLTPHVGTFAPSAGFVQRAQNAGSRLYGDPIPLRNRPVIEAGQKDLLGQVGATGPVTPGAVAAQGEAVSGQVASRAGSVVAATERNANMAQADASAILKQAQDRISADVGTPSGDLAGKVAQDIGTAKEAFSAKASEMYAPVDELVGKPLVPTAGLKEEMQRILSSLPQTAEGGNALSSEATRAFAKGIDSLGEFTTFQQMQNARILFRNKSAVDALNAGLSEGQAKRLSMAADRAFNDATASISTTSTSPIPGPGGKPITSTTTEVVPGVPDAVKALRRADAFYASGIKRFNDLSVEALVKDASQTGFIQPEKVAQYIAAPGQADKLMRIKKVVSPETFAEVGKVKWQELTGTSQDSLTGEVAGKKLSDKLAQMGGTLDVLYGQEQANKMRVLSKQLAAMDGKIDPATLSPGNITTAIQDAVRAEAKFKQAVSSDYLGMIKSDGPESVKAADWLTQPGNRLQLRNAIQTLGANSPEVQSLKEYLARKIVLTMEQPAAATEQKYGSTVLMGEPLKKTLAEYGKPYLEDVFGKEWTTKINKWADAVEVGTRRNPSDSGGLAAASIGLHPLRHLTDLAHYYALGWATAKSPTITWMTKGTPGFQDTSAIMEKLRGLAAGGTRAYLGTQMQEVPKSAADYAAGAQQHMSGQ